MATRIKGLEGFEKFVKELDDFGKKQLPFAIAQTLNKVGEIAQKDVSNKIVKTFDVSSGWHLPGRKYGPKKKKADKKNTAVTIYMNPPKNRKEHWVEDHEKGDARPDMQLITTRAFKKRYGHNKREAKKLAKRFLNAQKRNRIFETGISTGFGKNRKAGSKYGFRAIWQRGEAVEGKRTRRSKRPGRRIRSKVTGKLLKAREPSKILKSNMVFSREAIPLFIVEDSVKEKPVLGFEKTITNTFEKNFNRTFMNEFNWAMFNAK